MSLIRKISENNFVYIGNIIATKEFNKRTSGYITFYNVYLKVYSDSMCRYGESIDMSDYCINRYREFTKKGVLEDKWF